MITTTIMTTITKVRLTLMCTMLLATEIQESRAMLQGSTAQVTLDKRTLHFLHIKLLNSPHFECFKCFQLQKEHCQRKYESCDYVKNSLRILPI